MPNKKRSVDDAKSLEKQKAAKLRRVSREKDQALLTPFASFLNVLNADDAKAEWTKRSVAMRLHDGADFPSHTKGALLRDFTAVAGFPINYAFAIYSQRTTYPTKLRKKLQGLTAAQQSQFSLHYFNIKFPQKNQYEAHVFYLRCQDLTQNAEDLWMQLSGKAAAESEESESAASTPLSRVSSPPAVATAAASASAAGDEKHVVPAPIAALTTASIHRRLQSATSAVEKVTIAAARAASLAAVDSDGLLPLPAPTDIAPVSVDAAASLSLLTDDDNGELFPSGYLLAQENRKAAAAAAPPLGDANVENAWLVASPVPASPSNLQACLFGRVSPPPVTAPIYDSPLTPKFGFGSE